jgi:peptidyl-prolyl cis-trans isomerase C
MPEEGLKKQGLSPVNTAMTLTAVTMGVFLLGMGMFYAVQNLSAQPSSISTPKTGSKQDFVVARVNGSVIRYSDVIMAKRDLPPEFESLPQEVVYNALVEQLIERRLLAEAAWRAGIEQAPLTKSRLNFSREKILRDLYMVDLIETEVSDRSINSLYEKKYLSPEAGEEIHLHQILVRAESVAVATRQSIVAGEDFGDAARRVSVDVSAVRGGDLGFLTRDVLMQEIVQVAFGLELDEVSLPIKTRLGWHLIRITSRRTKAPPPLVDVREDLRRELLLLVVDREIEDLRGGARIKRYELPSTADLDRETIASQ